MLGTTVYVILGNTLAGEGSIEQLDMSLHHSSNHQNSREWELISIPGLPIVGQCAVCADPLTHKIVIFGGRHLPATQIVGSTGSYVIQPEDRTETSWKIQESGQTIIS